MKKGIHPENYRPVVFKESLAHLTHSTQVRASSLILLVALTAS